MAAARPSGARERAARRARSACSLAERIEAAEDWLDACCREAAASPGAEGDAARGALFATLARDGTLPDFPPDVLSVLHQRYG